VLITKADVEAELGKLREEPFLSHASSKGAATCLLTVNASTGVDFRIIQSGTKLANGEVVDAVQIYHTDKAGYSTAQVEAESGMGDEAYWIIDGTLSVLRQDTYLQIFVNGQDRTKARAVAKRLMTKALQRF